MTQTDIVILDLEWNAAYHKKSGGFLNEIIEFGAVKCGPDLTETDRFSCLVKPRISKRMNSYTAEMTHLSLDALAGGEDFARVTERFTAWAGDSLLMTWGTSDVLTLIENCRAFLDRESVPFLHRYCDLQAFFQARLGLGSREQVGLARAAELLDLDLTEMAQHRALDDSLITLGILRRVADPAAMSPFISVCDGEFYRRMTFRSFYITDPRSPLLSAEDLRFTCPACGGPAKRAARWRSHNRSMQADFRCPACGLSFSGRVTARQKYEGVTVQKKTVPHPVIEAPRAVTPGSLGGMSLSVEGGVGLLRFPAFAGLPVNHAFSTRAGGVSQGDFAAMNLGFGRGDEAEAVAENYRLFCAAAGFDPESLVCGAQAHHLNIRRVSAPQRGVGVWKEKDMEDVDGLCTDDPAVTLVIYCADCVPLYFVDPVHKAIGLAHAGWRGTVNGMAREMVRRMAQEFGSEPAALRVGIGPSIGPECFEVDAPVAEEFLRLPGAEGFVTGPEETFAGEKYHVDLWACNRDWLLREGVLPEHIAVGGVCTVCESDLLFSHRKTRGRRGSNAAFLSLAPAP